MSQAFGISRGDVHSVMLRMGIYCKENDEQVTNAFDMVISEDDRITEAALYGDDLEEQTKYAYDEIQEILMEGGF